MIYVKEQGLPWKKHAQQVMFAPQETMLLHYLRVKYPQHRWVSLTLIVNMEYGLPPLPQPPAC